MTAPTTASFMFGCQESLDSEQPTPLEFAFELIGINHKDEREALFSMVDADENETFFSIGWDSGIDCNLDEYQLPTREAREARAWLAGFVAGQFAAANGYPTPFCIFQEHEH